MKIRLYLNDFTLCTDIDWNSPILPQKGDMILLQKFINLEKGKSNVKHFTDYDGKCGVFNVSQGDRHTDTEYLQVKEIKEAIVYSGPIWRIMDDIQTVCFIVRTSNEHGIIDAYFENEQMN